MNKNDFLIPLNGLAAGRTRFSRVADGEFFKSFENTEIEDASLDVDIDVEKSGQYVGIDAKVEGYVSVPCDRCLEELKLDVSLNVSLSVKFGEESPESEDDGDSDREVIWLSEKNADFDMSQVIYDYVCLSLPLQRFHPEGTCNGDVVRYLESGISVKGSAPQDDSPFASLKGLFGN